MLPVIKVKSIYPHYGYSRKRIGFSIDNLWGPKKKYFPAIEWIIVVFSEEINFI
jgi:hypothetical protein